jgi:tripeptidyl-peptidase-1
MIMFSYPDTQSGGYDKPKMCGAYTPTNVISISYGFEETHLPLKYESRQCQEQVSLDLPFAIKIDRRITDI